MDIQTKKIGLSIIFGPLILLPAMSILGLSYSIFGSNEFVGFWETVLLFSAYGVIGLFVAYPVTIVFGLPTILALRSWNLFNLPVLIICSVIPSSIIFTVFEPSFSSMFFYGYSSGTVAVGCWLVYKWVR